MLTLIFAAVAVGLGNSGAAISIGLSGATAKTRIRVGAIFGAFESGMPLAGLLIGHGTASALGEVAGYVGGGLLILIGSWQLIRATRSDDKTPPSPTALWQLIVTGFALSIDNLVVGFTLGARNVPLAEAIVVFAAVSVMLSVLGLELGHRLSTAVEFAVEYAAAFVLIAVGVVVAVGKF